MNYLLKNVKPIAFPGYEGVDATDVTISDGMIKTVGHDSSGGQDWDVVDCDFAYLSPAWIDMHTHAYWGGSDIAAWPHELGLSTGVPIIVDAGSAGEGHFNGFYEFHIKRCAEQKAERILPFLNIGSAGLVATNRVPEVRLLRDIDIPRIMDTVAKYPKTIAGLKCRLCSIIESENDLLPLKLAKKLSRVLKLPLMVHIGIALPLVEEVLDRLDAGDILTHCFQGKPASSIVDDAVAFDAAIRAKERGVIFDIGHGSASFSYRVGREALRRGLLPDTTGSDLYANNLNGPVWDLSIVLSKMLAIGLTLHQAIAGATSKPRQALGLPGMVLESGAPAEFTLFTVETANINLPDSLGDQMVLEQRILPKAVFWHGKLTPAASRYNEETAL